MRIENNTEQDPSLFRENQPCTLAAMTTDITSSYTLFTWFTGGAYVKHMGVGWRRSMEEAK
jgi:hypothetical protein